MKLQLELKITLSQDSSPEERDFIKNEFLHLFHKFEIEPDQILCYEGSTVIVVLLTLIGKIGDKALDSIIEKGIDKAIESAFRVFKSAFEIVKRAVRPEVFSENEAKIAIEKAEQKIDTFSSKFFETHPADSAKLDSDEDQKDPIMHRVDEMLKGTMSKAYSSDSVKFQITCETFSKGIQEESNLIIKVRGSKIVSIEENKSYKDLTNS